MAKGSGRSHARPCCTATHLGSWSRARRYSGILYVCNRNLPKVRNRPLHLCHCAFLPRVGPQCSGIPYTASPAWRSQLGAPLCAGALQRGWARKRAMRTVGALLLQAVLLAEAARGASGTQSYAGSNFSTPGAYVLGAVLSAQRQGLARPPRPVPAPRPRGPLLARPGVVHSVLTHTAHHLCSRAAGLHQLVPAVRHLHRR